MKPKGKGLNNAKNAEFKVREFLKGVFTFNEKNFQICLKIINFFLNIL